MEAAQIATDTQDEATNLRIASRLRDYADLLDAQGEDGFRVRAFRRAADQVAGLDRSLASIYGDGGLDALVALPGIGRGIGAAIAEMLTTGQWTQLDRVRGMATPEAVFRSLPGVGDTLARRFAEVVHAETLEDLEAALERPDLHITGLGDRRRRAILSSLHDRLREMRLDRPPEPAETPSIELLLDADQVYRERAARDELRRIAPRRMNPERKAWLPIMHLRRGDWHLTALFSNTPRAHALKRTQDWVVLFHHLGDGPEGRSTVVTETSGALAGKRVVRGREAECAAYYAEGAEEVTRPASAR